MIAVADNPKILKAAAALRQLATASWGYDAVDDTARRQAPRSTNRSEDNVLPAAQRTRLTATTRQIRRNFSIAGWMIRKHLDYVSSFGFQARTGEKGLNARIEDLMVWWSRPANCDVAARHGLPMMTRLAECSRTVDGDVLLLKLSDGRLQAIEGDRIYTPYGTLPPGTTAAEWTHGVQTDAYGRAKAYMVCKRSKSGTRTYERILRAGFCLLHGYFDRFDQIRGISPLAAAINSLRDVYEGCDYALAKMKLSQLFGLVTYRESAEPLAPVSGQTDDDGDEAAEAKYDVDFGKGPFHLDLDPGDKADFLEAKTPPTEFREFCGTVIAMGLKGLDIPYSFYDESFTNFYGSRGGLIQYLKSCEAKRAAVRDLLDNLTAWRLRLFVEDGVLELPAGMNPADLRWEWVPAGVPWWDPVKEVRGHVAAIRSGLTTPQRVCQEVGTDFQDNVDAIAEAMAYAQERGVQLEFADFGPTTEVHTDAGN
ncbi:MAG TPA: phage portal protein [Phycisphaerae bacterium]|nr:phage portal protein [Phycisphaerae bacterium]